MFELAAIMLLRILISPSISQLDIMIESSMSHIDKRELSPTLEFGPTCVFFSIMQFFPIMTGPTTLEPSLNVINQTLN